MSGSLRGNIRVSRRKNKDKTVTYYLRWQIKGENKLHSKRLFRTEPNPDKASNKSWRRQARQAAYTLDDELNGPAMRHLYRLTLDQAFDWYMIWLCGDDERKPEHARQTIEAEFRIIRCFIDYVQKMWPKPLPKGWRVSTLSCRHMSSSGQRETDAGRIAKTPLGYWRWRLATPDKRTGKDLAISTIRTEVAVIRSWLLWCERHRYIDRCPAFVPPKAEPMSRPLIVEDQQVRDMLLRVRERRGELAYATLFTLATTGMRQGELKGLAVKDFVVEQRAISIEKYRRTRTKMHKRTLPLGTRGVELVAGCARDKLPDVPLFSPNGSPMKHQVRNWTLPAMKPHDLRRWFSNHLIGWGCPQQWTNLLMGHVNRGIDDYYSNATLEQLRGWTQRVEDLLL